MNEKEYNEYDKLLNDYEVVEKLKDVFVSMAKCLKYELLDENGEDITETIIKEEVDMENIDTEAPLYIMFLELKKLMK